MEERSNPRGLNWPAKLPVLPIRFSRRPIGLLEGWLVKTLLALGLAWLIFTRLGPQRPALAAPLRDMVDREAAAAVDDIAVKATAQRMGRLEVLHLDRDDSAYATAALRKRLVQRGACQQPDPTFAEKLRDLLDLHQPACTDIGSALAAGKSHGVDGVVFGKLSVAGEQAQLDLCLGDVASGKVVAIDRSRIAGASAPVVALLAVRRSSGAGSLLTELAVAALIILLLPVFTIGFIRASVRRRSNYQNAFALTVYTLADALILTLLLTRLSTGWMIGLLASGLVTAALYNISVMSWAVRLEDDAGTAP